MNTKTASPRKLTLEELADHIESSAVTLPVSAVVAEDFPTVDVCGAQLVCGKIVTFLLLTREEVAIFSDTNGEDISVLVDPRDKRLFKPLPQSEHWEGKLFHSLSAVIACRPCPKRVRALEGINLTEDGGAYEIDDDSIEEGDVFELSVEAGGAPRLQTKGGRTGIDVHRVVGHVVRADMPLFIPLETPCTFTAYEYDKPYSLHRLLRMESKGRLALPIRVCFCSATGVTGEKVVTIEARGDPVRTLIATSGEAFYRLPADTECGKIRLQKDLLVKHLQIAVPKMAALIAHDQMVDMHGGSVNCSASSTMTLSRLGASPKSVLRAMRRNSQLTTLKDSETDSSQDEHEDIAQNDREDGDDGPAEHIYARVEKAERPRRTTTRRRRVNLQRGASSVGESVGFWKYKYCQLERELDEVRQDLKDTSQGTAASGARPAALMAAEGGAGHSGAVLDNGTSYTHAHAKDLQPPLESSVKANVAGHAFPERLDQFSIDDVIAWLNANKLDQYTDVFAAEGVDGKLLAYLTDEMLKEDFGVQNGFHRMKIVRLMDKFGKD